MFDVGFSELIVIALVALIVIGPERLPRVARTVGALLGRAQRYVNDVKADIQREVDLEELKNLKSTFEDAAKSVEQSVNQVQQELNATADSLNQSISAAVEDKTVDDKAVENKVETGAPEHQAAAEIPIPPAQMDLGLETKPPHEPAAPPKV